jgi:DNA-binding transcriptional LysR family regulator
MALDQRIARRLKLRDLHVFDTVVRFGSMGKAAAQLAVSQPAISKSVTDLERLLGVRLLERSRQGVEPTNYGTALLKWSAVIFDNLRQGVDEIAFLADPTAGEVRVSSTEVMTAGLLPAVIDRLSRQYSRMTFTVIQAPTILAQYHDLRERNVDLILGRVVLPITDEDFDLEILFEDRLSIVAGLESKWQRRRKINPRELLDEPWALPPYDTYIGSIVKDAFREKNLDPPRMTVASASIQPYTALLATGRFLAIRPNSSLRLAGKRLSEKALSVDLSLKPVHVGIVTLSDRATSPAVKLFIECARAVAKVLSKAS